MNRRGVVCNQAFYQLSHWHFHYIGSLLLNLSENFLVISILDFAGVANRNHFSDWPYLSCLHSTPLIIS